MTTLMLKTLFNHGWANEDGSRREHCCGCWNLYAADAGEVERPAIYAECNECGEARDLSAPLHLDAS